MKDPLLHQPDDHTTARERAFALRHAAAQVIVALLRGEAPVCPEDLDLSGVDAAVHARKNWPHFALQYWAIRSLSDAQRRLLLNMRYDLDGVGSEFLCYLLKTQGKKGTVVPPCKYILDSAFPEATLAEWFGRFVRDPDAGPFTRSVTVKLAGRFDDALKADGNFSTGESGWQLAGVPGKASILEVDDIILQLRKEKMVIKPLRYKEDSKISDPLISSADAVRFAKAALVVAGGSLFSKQLAECCQAFLPADIWVAGILGEDAIPAASTKPPAKPEDDDAYQSQQSLYEKGDGWQHSLEPEETETDPSLKPEDTVANAKEDTADDNSVFTDADDEEEDWGEDSDGGSGAVEAESDAAATGSSCEEHAVDADVSCDDVTDHTVAARLFSALSPEERLLAWSRLFADSAWTLGAIHDWSLSHACVTEIKTSRANYITGKDNLKLASVISGHLLALAPDADRRSQGKIIVALEDLLRKWVETSA